jgi:hypothetical protein
MPKWVKTAMFAVGALACVGFVDSWRWLGFVGGRTANVLDACAAIGIGFMAFLAGVFVKEFHLGEDSRGPPMPRWAGATLFILISLGFIVAGIVGLLRA